MKIEHKIGRMLVLLVTLVLFDPQEAFSQSRYWSTSRGIAGALIQSKRPRPYQARVPSVASASSSAALNSSSGAPGVQLPPIAQRSGARAALRHEEAAEVQSEGVKVEIFIDARTNEHLQKMSEQTGVPRKELLYKFLRRGHVSYARQLQRQ